MKKSCILIGFLCLVNFLVTATFVLFMPDQVPVHFGVDGKVNRIGSRFESFALPIIALLVAFFTIADAKTNDRGNTKTIIKVGIASQIIFIGISLFTSSRMLSFENNAMTSSADTIFSSSLLSGIVFGVMLLVFGNLMPKTTRNSTFGIRLPWTFESDEIWQKTHRIGGYLSIVFGLVTLMCSFIFTGETAFILQIAILFLWTISCLVTAYVVHRKATGC